MAYAKHRTPAQCCPVYLVRLAIKLQSSMPSIRSPIFGRWTLSNH